MGSFGVGMIFRVIVCWGEGGWVFIFFRNWLLEVVVFSGFLVEGRFSGRVDSW